jgi:hypothetical protein
MPPDFTSRTLQSMQGFGGSLPMTLVISRTRP